MADPNRDSLGASALTLKQLTPVLIVDAVEPCIKFWTDRLGFEVTNQVPDTDGKLIFASVQKGSIEIMYQTRASVISEQPGSAPDLTGHSVALFMMSYNFLRPHMTLTKANDGRKTTPAMAAGVASCVWTMEDLVAMMERLVVDEVPFKLTMIYVKEPGGNTVGFAQFS